EHAAALVGEGAAHLDQSPRFSGGDLRGGGACPPCRVRGVEALVRKGGGSLGAEGSPGAVGSAGRQPPCGPRRRRGHRGRGGRHRFQEALVRARPRLGDSRPVHDDEGGAGGGIAAGEPGPYPPGPAVTWTAPAGQRAWPRGPVTGGGRRGGLYTLRVLRRW